MHSKAIQLGFRILLVILIFEITGGHWVVLQTVAWSQMIVDYSRTTSFKKALKETFDGQHPCDLCKSIEKAKQNEKKQDTLQVHLKRELFTLTYSRILLSPPRYFWLQDTHEMILNTIYERPLLQPPRSLLG